jgi:enterochelin esterase-like enzyme
MKKFPCIVFLMALSLTIIAQGGKVFDNLSMKSTLLETDKKYSVYLPPDYETSQRSYPVLYLLHGGQGNQTTWVQHGQVKYITDKAIREGKSTPMIIVMPDAGGARRGFYNYPSGVWPYEDYFFQEFMPFIEKTYRIRPGKRYRSVAGLSMGGKGTFIYALHHPELFNCACPLSKGALPSSLDEIKVSIRRFDPDASDSQLEKYYYGHDILDLINNMPEKQINAVKWYIDCGDDDPRQYEGHCNIHIAMRKKNIPHEFRVRDGAHNWIYWRSALPDVLEFITRNISN